MIIYHNINKTKWNLAGSNMFIIKTPKSCHRNLALCDRAPNVDAQQIS